MTPILPRLFLIRHGETEWSLSGRHTGRTDVPLTIHGTAIAGKLRAYLAGLDFTCVLTSPLERARATCALAGLAVQAEVTPDLSEWDYGDYEGQRTVEIRQQAPGWNVFRDGCLNGETPTQIADRADKLIARLLALSGDIALFSHGQFGCVLAARWIGLAVIEAQHLALDPASVSVLGPKSGHPTVSVISQWNAGPAVHYDLDLNKDTHARS
ncbi:histidine phosphatase family protein [Sphingomonas sp. UYP23]